MADIYFYAQFVASKVGKNSLTPTIDVEEITKSTGVRSALVTGGSTTAVGRRGLYYYRLTNADLNTKDYVVTFITSDTSVDQQEIAALQTDYSSAVWTSPVRDLTSFGTLIADIWSYATRSLTTFGTLVSDIWSNSTRTLSSFGTLVADIWGYTSRTLTSFASLAADVWSYATRTITEFPGTETIWAYPYRTLTETPEDIQDKLELNELSIYKYTTVIINQTLGNITGVDNVWFTIKNNKNDDDIAAVIQVSSVDGLIHLWKETTIVDTDASVTVNNAAAGSITIEILPDASSLLPVGDKKFFDIKVDIDGIITVVREGLIDINMPVTRAIEAENVPVP